MPIVHQHGLCSPLADKRGKAPSHTEILAADQRRVEYIHRRQSETTGRVRPKRAATPIQLQSRAPSTPTTLASAPSHCQPCVAYCYRQQEPLFSPAKSSTYANISCSSSYCDDLDIRGCTGGHCLYEVQYGDGSFTIGFYAHETLTLAKDVVKNRGKFGRSAGLMGLGRGKTSLPVQTYDKYMGVFASCLPAKASGTTGFLEFGTDAAATNTRLTPMMIGKGETFYYVGLTGIEVGGHLLSIPESVFSTAGALMDSSTAITRLPPSVYPPLRSAFAKDMERLGYKKAPAFKILDTCYNLTGQGSIVLPAVSLVFQGGASLDVHPSGILYVLDVSQACLAFAPNDDDTAMAIIGNTQQKTYNVLYELGN
ncbi:Aspartyl protease family protein [Dichanthelium oligosanthes]|uniref:Aspartyl protease family protein n=1 Tax=Dichanthelium oligosanthes TaxID=888268 RepID=A0A1E5WJU3_9POAL|nr:Aspartyl protease family protein [Dichanthelium oligosanthes]